MSQQSGRSGRYFTEAARAKALEVRKAKAFEPKPHLEVFITRDPSVGRLFAWEIRQFGGVVLDRSQATFVDATDAKRAGEAVLAAEQSARGAAGLKSSGYIVSCGIPREVKTCSSSSIRTMAGAGTASN